MIVWDRLKIANNSVAAGIEIKPKNSNTLLIDKGLEVSGALQTGSALQVNGVATFNNVVDVNGNLSANGINTSGAITGQSLTIQSAIPGSAAAQISPTNLSIQNITATTITTPAINVTVKATINAAAIDSASINDAQIEQGNIAVNVCNIGNTAQLPVNTTVDGRKFEECCFAPYFTNSITLDAYQGPGANWIKIRNLSSDAFTVNNLKFSGNEWSAFTISAGATWQAEDMWGWGANDNPGNIEISYQNEDGAAWKRIPPAEWTQQGWVSLEGSSDDPGYRTIAKTDNFWVAIGNDSTQFSIFDNLATSFGYTHIASEPFASGIPIRWFRAYK